MKLHKLINRRQQQHQEGGDISETEKGKGKSKVHPRTGHEGPEGQYVYSCIVSLTSALNGGGERHAPAALPKGKTHVLIVQETGWAPGQVWTGAENLATTGVSSPARPTPQRVAIPNELTRLLPKLIASKTKICPGLPRLRVLQISPEVVLSLYRIPLNLVCF